MPIPAPASAAGLRSRKVDNKKPLPVIRFADAPDLDDPALLLSRSIPHIATGVEKEEEEEHHLQAALVANQTHTQVVIPTPDASKLILDSHYDSLYTSVFQLPKSLIRFSTAIDDLLGCPYNLDERDDAWLAAYNDSQTSHHSRISHDSFEYVIAILEAAGNDKVSGQCPSIDECLAFFARPDVAVVQHRVQTPGIREIYNHWRLRRYGSPSEPGNGPLIPRLKFEELSLTPESDPYVCFRRREVRQMRKARRTDNLALDKLRRLREDLMRARAILECVAQREILTRESFHLEHLIFERRVCQRILKRRLGVTSLERDTDVTPEARRKKSRRGTAAHIHSSAAAAGSAASANSASNPLYDGHGNDASEIPEVPESTKIRIPMQKLRDAANLVSDIDSKLFVEHYSATASSVEDKVRKIRNSDEKGGWADVTEDPYLGIGSDAFELWRTLSLASTAFDKHASESHDLAMRWTSRVRRRIGRGGRIVFDRKLSRPARKSLDAVLSRWRFDASDDELDEETEIDDDIQIIAHRALSTAPREDEYRILTGKVAYIEQVYPMVVPGGLQSNTASMFSGPPPPAPLHVIRTASDLQAAMESVAATSSMNAVHASDPNNHHGHIHDAANASEGAPGSTPFPTSGTAPSNKKKSRANTSSNDAKQPTPGQQQAQGQSTSSASQKKKPQEPHDARTAAVKAMMIQAQRQAQHAQAHVQQQLNGQAIQGQVPLPIVGAQNQAQGLVGQSQQQQMQQQPQTTPDLTLSQTQSGLIGPSSFSFPAANGLQSQQSQQPNQLSYMHSATDVLAQVDAALSASSLAMGLPQNVPGSMPSLNGNLGGLLANPQLQHQFRLNQMRMLQHQQALIMQQQQQQQALILQQQQQQQQQQRQQLQQQQQQTNLTNFQLQLQLKALQQQQQQQQLAQAQSLLTAQSNTTSAAASVASGVAAAAGTSASVASAVGNHDPLASAMSSSSFGLNGQLPQPLTGLTGSTNSQQQLQQLYLAQQQQQQQQQR